MFWICIIVMWSWSRNLEIIRIRIWVAKKFRLWIGILQQKYFNYIKKRTHNTKADLLFILHGKLNTFGCKHFCCWKVFKSLRDWVIRRTCTRQLELCRESLTMLLGPSRAGHTRQHCRDNVTMFSDHKDVGWLLHYHYIRCGCSI